LHGRAYILTWRHLRHTNIKFSVKTRLIYSHSTSILFLQFVYHMLTSLDSMEGTQFSALNIGFISPNKHFTCCCFHEWNMIISYHKMNGYLRSLIRTIAVRLPTIRETHSKQHGSWSDCADAQAGLDLCWSQTHYVGFCRDAAHITIN
jgi:hypothetical protein